jgi:3-deoxy-7-phosphoheptulonate synthase
VIEVNGRRIGDDAFGLIAGPCTVEYREQTLETARAVAQAGATMLRGGAFKPRTSPYTFSGLGEEALEILVEAREETGLPIVTELMDPAPRRGAARARGRDPDRRAQHAELQPPLGGRGKRTSRCC